MEDSIIGTEVEGYRIEEMLGRGGMGVVYRAEDIALSRDVALKRIAPSLANDESFLRRFRSEAQALARIDSPYIVSVHALRQADIGLLIVMEFVEGGTVKDLIEEGPMDWQDVLPLTKQMLKALEHAHGAGVIHRDVKPENVMLSTTRTVKVTDFGLAKVHRGDSKATVTQGVHGTLNYMSPEQVKGRADLDHRSDIYSLGMTVYEMLACELPFDEDSNEFEQMRAIVEEEFPPPHEVRPQVPEEISTLVMKALEKNPDDRFQSAEGMREAVETFEKEHAEESSTQPAPPDSPTQPARPDSPTQPASTPAESTPDAQPTSEESPTQPSPESEPETTSSSTRWPLLAGAAVLVLVLAGGGYMVFAGEGLGGGESGPPTTQVSVSTDPPGAAVLLDGRQIGTTPLADTMIEGRTAQLRVQKAGYVAVDTVAQLDGKNQVGLHVPLTREKTSLTLRSDPVAQISIDGKNIGRTPVIHATRKGTVRVRMEREGYVPFDTTLAALAQADQAEIDASLEPRPQPTPPGGSNGRDNGGDPSPTYGALTVAASPSSPESSVTVDGDAREIGQSIQVRAGTTHEVRISHPEYGHCDTTLTVKAEETQSLTCYFEHQVVVRSDPWAQIFLDEENTGESTNHRMQLKTGRTYEIKARILSRPYEVTGGTFRRIATESYEVITEKEFQGNTKSITLRPSFEQETYGLEFRTTESQSSR